MQYFANVVEILYEYCGGKLFAGTVPENKKYLPGQSKHIRNYLPGLSCQKSYLPGLTLQTKNYLPGLFRRIKNYLVEHLISTFFFHLLYFALSCVILFYHMLSNANILLFCAITSYSYYTLPYPSF